MSHMEGLSVQRLSCCVLKGFFQLGRTRAATSAKGSHDQACRWSQHVLKRLPCQSLARLKPPQREVPIQRTRRLDHKRGVRRLAVGKPVRPGESNFESLLLLLKSNSKWKPSPSSCLARLQLWSSKAAIISHHRYFDSNTNSPK